jgi:hypothetical protein
MMAALLAGMSLEASAGVAGDRSPFSDIYLLSRVLNPVPRRSRESAVASTRS